MPLVKNGCFASDEINLLIGFDGSEHKSALAWHSQHKSRFPCRIAFAINQYYPELTGGFYRNKRLIAVVQRAMADIGLYIVLSEHYFADTAVPAELEGTLEEKELYTLVDEALTIQGMLQLWESLGGRSPFYHDRLIIEIVVAESYRDNLSEKFKRKCVDLAVICNIS